MRRQLDFALGVPLIKVLSLLKKSPAPAEVKASPKILIIKLAAMGDAIILIPVLRSLRQAFPSSEIHWLVSGVNIQLARTVPFVDKFHLWNPVSASTFWPLVKNLKKEKFDVVIDAEQWARVTALLSFFTKAPRRIGFDTPGQSRAGLFTDAIPKRSQQHELKEFFNLFSALKPLSENSDLESWETDNGIAELERWNKDLKKNAGPLVLFHPGCGADGTPREWPLAEYALLGNWLLTHHHARLILTGGPEERAKTRQLFRLLNGKALDLGGELSWQGTVSLVKRVDLVVSGNTGVMHVAAALRKPQVALHGPTNAELWGPLNPNAKVIRSSCAQCPCLVLGFEYHAQDQSCMTKIDLADVKKAVSSLIDNHI